uniref:Uncharacterized protein n=1 Tax=Brassica oleracea var. oleracea TaxID=109376 RepID=A0A0D3CE35_BRAOL
MRLWSKNWDIHKMKENPGRSFFRCPTFRNDHLYEWVDEAVYEEVHDALPKVECFASDMRKIKMEIDSLKTVEEELKKDVRKLNVIIKVGFLVASVSCLVLIMRK